MIVSGNREAIPGSDASEADSGTELTSNAVLSSAGETGIDWHYVAPGGVALAAIIHQPGAMPC